MINGINHRKERQDNEMEDSEDHFKKETYATYKIINDSVHGHIKLHELCIKIMDTIEFQRLRNIKQLGVAYMVYPGASHNRFEHSLGVCYLARQMVNKLVENDKQWSPNYRLLDEHPISETQKLCLEIAGLCHDLGHGPFSHMWEHVVSEWEPGSDWVHENSSIQIFDEIAQKLKNDFKKFSIEKKQILFIKNLILGLKPTNKKIDGKKQFLFEIVANQRNKIDVDKWDYLLRDGHHLNLNNSFDYRRLLEFCHIVEIKDTNEYRIGFRDREIDSLCDIFRMRAEFHLKAYQHEVVKNIETMYIDAFVSAGDYLVHGRIKLKEAHKHWKSHSQLTDHIYYDILYDESDKTEQARKIFKNVCERRLYKFIGKHNLPADGFDKKKEELKKNLETEFPDSSKNFKISIVKIDMDIFDEKDLDIVLYQQQKIGIDADTGKNCGSIRYKPVVTRFQRNMIHYPIEMSYSCQRQVLLFYANTDEDIGPNDITRAKQILEKL